MSKDYWPLSPKTQKNFSKNSVDIWSICLEQPKEITLDLRQILAPDELDRADRFYFDKDRNHFTVARAGLRKLLGEYLDLDPKSIKFSYEKKGKPFLENNKLCFNLSHSKDLALCAITYDRTLGVDVEYLREMKDAEQIAKRFFSSRESSLFCSLPKENQRLAFFRCWTRKEAFVKALGDGISYGLDNFDVTFTSDKEADLIRVLSDPLEANRWKLKELLPAEDYVGAIIVKGNDWDLNCWKYNI
jgi:4'-phosphopantetheinyl transferase